MWGRGIWWPWRSTRCASQGGRGRGRCPRIFRRAWRPSRARSRGRSLCRTRRDRRGRRRRCWRDLFWRACRSRGRGERREVPGAVFGGVRDVFGGELLDECDHVGDALGGVGDVLGVLDGEGVEVLEEGFDVLGGVLVDGKTGGSSVADDLVVDVSDVHDVLSGNALLPDKAAEDVDVEEGAEVADVSVVVDGGAATVHAEGWCALGQEGFDSAAESIEEFDGCHVALFFRRRPAVADADCSRWMILVRF